MAKNTAKLGIDVESNADKAAKELDNLTEAGRKAETQSKKVEKAKSQERDANGRFVKSVKEVTKATKESGEAAAKTGTQSKKATDEAGKLGDELDDLGESGKKGAAGVDETKRAVIQAGDSMGARLATFRNIGFQLNQIGQQGLVTGNYLQAAAIQLPDILGAFGSLPLILAGAAAGLALGFLPQLFKLNDTMEELREKTIGLGEDLDRVEMYDFDDVLTGMKTASEGIRTDFTAILDLAQRTAQEALQMGLAEAKEGIGLEAELKTYGEKSQTSGRYGEVEFDAMGFTDVDRAIDAALLLRQIGGETREEIARSLEEVVRGLEGSGLMTDALRQNLVLFAESLGINELINDEVQAQVSAEQAVADGMAAHAAASRQAYDRAQARVDKAYEELDANRSTADIMSLIVAHGEDSEIVAQARLMAERDLYEEKINALHVSEQEKQEMMAAWDAANGIAGAGMAANIAAAVSQAIALAANLDAAARSAMVVAAFNKASAAANPDWKSNMGGRGDTGSRSGPANDPNGYSGASDFANSMSDEERALYNAINRGMTPQEAYADAAEKAARAAKRAGGGGSKAKKGRKGGKSEAEKAADEAKREAERIDDRFNADARRWYEQTMTSTEEYQAELRDLAELNKLGYFKDYPEAYGRAVAEVGQKYREARFGDQIQAFEDINSQITDAIANSKTLGEVWGNLKNVLLDLVMSGGKDLISGGLNTITGSLFPGTTATAGAAGGENKGNWWQNLGATVGGAIRSFDGGGYTGNGPRSGGVDGKGGFYALMHPQERVEDLTKPGSSGSTGGTMAVDVRISMDKNMNFVANVESIAEKKATQAVKQYDKSVPERINNYETHRRVR